MLDSFGVSVGLALGPRPAAEALAALDGLLPELRHPADAFVRALLLAMLDRTEEAWAVGRAAEERVRELGASGELGWLGEVALLVGDLETAASYLKTASDAFEASGSSAVLSGIASRLGQVLCRLDRCEEAQAFAEKGRELTDPDDVSAQVAWRQAFALVHSARGEHAAAERIARDAVSWASRSDSPVHLGEAYADLGEVLEAAGRREDAIAAWREALDCYERKEVVPLVRRVRERIAALEPA
jgi:tetratricopeptide (TPR) repeat protein